MLTVEDEAEDCQPSQVIDDSNEVKLLPDRFVCFLEHQSSLLVVRTTPAEELAPETPTLYSLQPIEVKGVLILISLIRLSLSFS